MTEAMLLTFGQSDPYSGGNLVALAVFLVPLALALIVLAGLWKVFTKAGRPGWGALVPFYNLYLLCKIAGRPGWWILLLLVPVVNLLIGIILSLDIAKAFDRGVGFGIGLILLPFIFYPVLGLSAARYRPDSIDGEEWADEPISAAIAAESPRPDRPTPQPMEASHAEHSRAAREAEPEPVPMYARSTIGSEVNDVLRSLLPWVTSLLIHLGVILLAFFMVWSYLTIKEELDPIIPIARLSDDPGGELSETRSVDLQATQNQREVKTQAVAMEDALNNLNLNTNSKLELVGLSGGGSGKIAPFGTTTGADSGISAKFYGAGGNATRLVYIVDASGSLIDTLPFVIRELKRSISELSDKQRFTVIFFQGGSAVEVPPRGWKYATPDAKERVADWITLEAGNIVPRGSTNPIAALKLALRYQPELVFILSDNITGRGRYEVDREGLLRLLDAANPDRRIKINTIQFLYPDPLDTLKAIADKHGGIYTFITESDLGLQ